MSNALPARPERDDQPRSFAIVASTYNSELVDGLVAHATEEIKTIAPNAVVRLIRVPGSFEIPVTIRALLHDDEYDDGVAPLDAVFAFGVLLEGETAHAQIVAQAVTQSLMQLSVEYGVPVIHEVLLVKNVEQARARCLEPDLNRGVEAARAACRMARLLSEPLP